jgi:hypothetical protein
MCIRTRLPIVLRSRFAAPLPLEARNGNMDKLFRTAESTAVDFSTTTTSPFILQQFRGRLDWHTRTRCRMPQVPIVTTHRYFRRSRASICWYCCFQVRTTCSTAERGRGSRDEVPRSRIMHQSIHVLNAHFRYTTVTGTFRSNAIVLVGAWSCDIFPAPRPGRLDCTWPV